VYHVPVSRGDSCAVWARRISKSEFRKSEVGKERESGILKNRNPETRSPKVPKSSETEEP
jgi:hypothetical protein